MHESSGGPSCSPSLFLHWCISKAGRTAAPISFPARQSLSRSMPAVDRQPSTPLRMAISALCAPAGDVPAPPRFEGRAWVASFPPLKALPWVGSCPPLNVLLWVGGFPLTSNSYIYFRTHGPGIQIDDLSTSPGTMVACLSTSLATGDSCTARGAIFPAAHTVFASVILCPPREARVTPGQSHLSRRSTQETNSAGNTGPMISISLSLGTPTPFLAKTSSDCISTWTRRRTVTSHLAVGFPYFGISEMCMLC